jgi:hypothetical protein
MAQRAHLGRAGLPAGLHHGGRVPAVSCRRPGDTPPTLCAGPPLWACPLGVRRARRAKPAAPPAWAIPYLGGFGVTNGGTQRRRLGRA